MKKIIYLIILLLFTQFASCHQGKKVLIILVHPDIEKSVTNKTMTEAVQDLKNVTVHNLYQNYPNFKIDADREQELLRSHDVVIFQFPFYWYSSPALLKQWQDKVLTESFAYGDTPQLKGKELLIATSTGATKGVYSHSGSAKYTVEELLLPFESTARFCQMKYLPPLVIYGVANANIDGEDIGVDNIKMQKIRKHAELYQKMIEKIIAKK